MVGTADTARLGVSFHPVDRHYHRPQAFLQQVETLEPLATFRNKIHPAPDTRGDPRTAYLREVQNLPVTACDNIFTAFVNETQKTWGRVLLPTLPFRAVLPQIPSI